jgi:hypothetical protein
MEEKACVTPLHGRLLQACDAHHELRAPIPGVADTALDKLLERKFLFQLVNDLQFLQHAARPGQLLTVAPYRVVRNVRFAPPINAIQANRHGLGRTTVRLSQSTPPPNWALEPRQHAGGGCSSRESDAMLAGHKCNRLGGEGFRHARGGASAPMGDGIGKGSDAIIIQKPRNREIEKFTVTSPELVCCAVTPTLLVVRYILAC